MTGRFDWESGSGGEHYYATIFCIELNNLIICYQIGKVCMSIEIRIIKINAEILFYYLKLYHQPFGWIVVAVTPIVHIVKSPQIFDIFSLYKLKVTPSILKELLLPLPNCSGTS